MTIQDFEIRLKNINNDLRIVPHPTNLDVAGIYYKHAYLCAMPSQNIYEEKKMNYTDAYGTPHATISEVEGQIRNFLLAMKNDSEMYDLMAKPADKL